MKTKLIIWAGGCLAVSALFLRELWVKLPQWLSPAGLQQHGVFHWGVLCLCILWLWMKRGDLLQGMRTARYSILPVITGVILVAASVFLPRTDDFLLFLMFAGWLGLFTVFFSRASVLPSALLAVYGFSIAFPVLFNKWAGQASALFLTGILTGFTRLFGLPVSHEGALLRLTSAHGEAISTYVAPGCAGYATLGVFISLFALMMLDVRLPLRKAWYVFLIGLAGTWLQNFIRVFLSVVAGYFWGAGAMDTLHYNAAYIIFPLWFALFVFIYLKQAGWSRNPPAKNDKLPAAPATRATG